jgi:VanZ like family
MRKWVWVCTKLVPLLLWIAIILWIASRPSRFFFAPDGKPFFGLQRRFIQYPYHVSAFFTLAILFLRCFWSANDLNVARKPETFSLVGSVLVSICSELIQFYVPTRTPAFRDLALDVFGATLAIIFVRHKRSGSDFK